MEPLEKEKGWGALRNGAFNKSARSLLALCTFLHMAAAMWAQHPTPCPIPSGMPLDSLIPRVVEQYTPGMDEEKRAKYLGSYTLDKLEQFQKAMREAPAPLDSLFQIARTYLVEHLGEEMFCRRVTIPPHRFEYSPNRVAFQFLFSLQDAPSKAPRIPLWAVFKHRGSGRYEFIPPDNVPHCVKRPTDCTFQILSPVQAVRKLQAEGLLDIATPYHLELRTDKFQMEILQPVGPGYLHKFTVGMRDGNVQVDTVMYPSYIPWAIEEWVEKASWVVEAKEVKKTKGYLAKGNIHTSHVFKITKVFKGLIERDTFEIAVLGGQMDGSFTMLSHGVDLPREGIFFLECRDDPGAYRSEDSLANYPQMYTVVKSLGYPAALSYWGNNIATYLHPALEQAAGQPYRTVGKSLAKDTALLQWLTLMAPDSIGLAERQGLMLYLKYDGLDTATQTITLRMMATTSFDFSYPEKMRFVIAYNPAAFGDSIVTAGRLSVSREYMTSGWQPSAFFPGHYTLQVSDLASGQFEIVAENTRKGLPPKQLPPLDPFTLAHKGSTLFTFSLPVLSDTTPMGIRLLNSPFSNDFTHHHIKTGQARPYAFTFIKKSLNFPVIAY